MPTVSLETTEYTFGPLRINDHEIQYRAWILSPMDVAIYRIGSPHDRMLFDIPRNIAEKLDCKSKEEKVRYVIGQALRDNLFDNPPKRTVRIDADARMWEGNLKLGSCVMLHA